MSAHHTDQPKPAAPAVPPAPQPVVTGARPQPRVQMPAESGEAPATALAERLPDDWPYPGYDGPQPFEVNEPPQITHDRGFVTSMTAGPHVEELCACLALLGFETPLSKGQNPHAIYARGEAAAVDAFRAAYGVEEAPEVIRATGRSVVGPWTWEALFRAVRAKEAEAEG
jgi:hypothetical protein